MLLELGSRDRKRKSEALHFEEESGDGEAGVYCDSRNSEEVEHMRHTAQRSS